MIVDHRGTHTPDLVGADRGPDAAAANGHPALNLTGGNGAAERYDEIGIVVVRV